MYKFQMRLNVEDCDTRSSQMCEHASDKRQGDVRHLAGKRGLLNKSSSSLSEQMRTAF